MPRFGQEGHISAWQVIHNQLKLNNEDIRSKHNIPEDARVVSYFVGEGEEDAINAFGSAECPQPLENHIQYVSRVKVKLRSTFILETPALLDTK